MRNNLETLFRKYQQKGIFLDTNILVLFISGSVDFRYIEKFNRGKTSVDESDFKLISDFIDSFQTKITTPQILSEVSNFLDKSDDLCFGLKTYIECCGEIFIESKTLSNSPSFYKFGIADSSVIEVSKDGYLVFTNDSKLLGYLNNTGIDAVNTEWLKGNSSEIYSK